MGTSHSRNHDSGPSSPRSPRHKQVPPVPVTHEQRQREVASTLPAEAKQPLVSARIIAQQGPWVSDKTGPQLQRYYAKYAPDKNNSEHIQIIVETKMEIAELNEKLVDKYGVSLDDFLAREAL